MWKDSITTNFILHTYESELCPGRTIPLTAGVGHPAPYSPLAYLMTLSAVFTLLQLPYASAVTLSKGGAPSARRPSSAAHRSSPSHQLPIVSKLGGEIYRAPATLPGHQSIEKPKCGGLLSGGSFFPPYNVAQCN